MPKSRYILPVFFLMLIPTAFFSCRDEAFDNDPAISLSFSADSVLFDTVFTTLGSSTRNLRVYNKHNRRINISSVSLGSGSQSYFRINADGRSGSIIHDVEVAANDSIFIFVEVTVDPVNQDLPLIISDSIIFNINNNLQDVKLVAWGQDAHFIHPNYTDANGISFHLFEENTVWTNDLPYVIYGLAVMAPDKELTVTEGARIHFHNNSSLIFLGGSSLKVNGSSELPVVFQGDRLEQAYSDRSGQWGRIWLTATSKDHDINHAIIKNGTVGIQVDSIGHLENPTLRIKNTIIRNMSIAGLIAQGSHVVAENTVMANCGESTTILALGGTYDFRHCTFANYYSSPSGGIRQTPSLLLNNYYVDVDENVQLREFNLLYFANTIIYGNREDEMFFDFLPGTQPDFTFDHCLIRTSMATTDPAYINTISNQNPQFNNIFDDYRLKDNSPAIGAANPDIAIQIPFDILGNDRTQRHDIGAYQYYEIPEEE